MCFGIGTGQCSDCGCHMYRVDLPQNWAFLRGMGVATFCTPGKGGQGIDVDG